jgi:hypothetical protein
MSTKNCFKCDVEQPLENFYKHPQMADGRVNKCKECNKHDNRTNRKLKINYYTEYEKSRFQSPERKAYSYKKTEEFKLKYAEKVKEYKLKSYKNNSESIKIKQRKYVKNNPEKIMARAMLNNAVRDGKVKKYPCIKCGDIKSQAHHCDYLLPFDVIWLCAKHHREIHN